MTLHAVTRSLPEAVDPAAVAGADGVLFARADGASVGGRGVALRGPVDEITAALAAADTSFVRNSGTEDDFRTKPGVGPIAVGALPFRPGAEAELIVPATTVVTAPDGSAWLTTIGEHDVDLDALIAPAPPRPGPGRFEVESARPPQEWCDAVATATARIRAGELEKVVLAREITVTADAPIDVAAVVRRLRLGFPGCYTFLVDGFVGASPELLVARHGSEVRSQPMAGTAPRRGDPAADADAVARLQASPSYRHEHQVTIDAVYDALVPFCSYLDFEAEPSVVALPNVTHLATTVAGQLSTPAPSVLELVAALHPTPAVCGRPRDAALAVIDELEGFDRGPYAGAVGWTDRHGNGEWAVAIRSAVIDGPRARVFGGNGIVGDSDPPTELIETRAKLQAVLGVLVRP